MFENQELTDDEDFMEMAMIIAFSQRRKMFLERPNHSTKWRDKQFIVKVYLHIINRAEINSKMASFLKWYKHYNQNYPIRINLIQTGFLFGVGDLIAQTVVEKRKSNDIDWLRTVRYVSIGCAVGPSLTMWYRVLDKFGTCVTVPTVAKKILADQLIASPIVSGSIMIMSRVFSGDEWSQIQKKFETNYVTVMLNSYVIWPAVQVANFTVVPQQYRVLLVQIVSLGWNIYLSFMSVGGGTSKETSLADNTF